MFILQQALNIHIHFIKWMIFRRSLKVISILEVVDSFKVIIVLLIPWKYERYKKSMKSQNNLNGLLTNWMDGF